MLRLPGCCAGAVLLCWTPPPPPATADSPQQHLPLAATRARHAAEGYAARFGDIAAKDPHWWQRPGRVAPAVAAWAAFVGRWLAAERAAAKGLGQVHALCGGWLSLLPILMYCSS